MDLNNQIVEYYDKKTRPPKQRDYFYISELGASEQELYNNIKSSEERIISDREKRIFENGNYVHARWMKVFAEMGILIAAEVEAVKNDLISGRADAIISDKKELFVVDVKSCSQWTFNKLNETPYRPMMQLMGYMYFLNIPKGIILYENKDNQAVKIFYIDLDKSLIEKELQKMRHVKEAIKNNILIKFDEVKMEDLNYGN